MDDTTMTREQELAEEFKAGLDPDAAGELAKRMAALEASQAEWEKQRESLLEDTAKAIDARNAADAERDALQAKLDAAAKAEPKVAQGDKPAKVRNLGPVKEALSGDDLVAAMAKADEDGDTVEIAFSDGKREIAGIPPKVVTGDVWRKHALGLMLRDPVTVEGPATGGSSVAIAGYALLIDGKQVAYCERADPVTVAPGQHIGLSDDIYF